MPSKKNYADPPSRVYRGKSLSLERPSLGLSERWLVALHLYSGRRRDGDFENALRAVAAERGVLVICFSLDIRVSCKHDLLRNKLFSQLRFWCWSGRVFFALSGSPCSTWTKLRYRPGGPPPLRSRENLFGLPSVTGRDLESVR